MRRAATAVAALALVIGVAVCGAASAATAADCEACLLAGAASVPLRVLPGTPLAGYGSLSRRRLVPALFERGGHAVWFKSHTAIRDPLRVRALVLEQREVRVVWVTLDAVAVDASFTARVRSALGRTGGPPPTVVISASHTHSGPGAFLDSWVMGFVAADVMDRAVRDAMVESVMTAVAQAEKTLVPATVTTTRVAGPAVTKGRLGAPSDPDLAVVRIDSAMGKPVALVWNYAIHGTMLPAQNLALSGDVMGLASATLERDLGVPALFVNGSVGDASPAGHGPDAMTQAAATLAAAVRRADHAPSARVPVTLATRTTRVALPTPALSIRNCTRAWVPRWLRLPLAVALPDSAELTAFTLGDTAVVTIPGELQGRLGERLEHDGGARWRHVLVAGVSNDYLGYFVTASDYARPAYVTCAALYGAEGGERLTAAAAELVRRLGESDRAPRAKVRGATATRSAARGDAARERGLLASRGVAVNHTLRDGLVQGADRLADGLGDVGARGGVTAGRSGRLTAGRSGRLTRHLDGGADARADGSIAQPPPLALPHLLHRRLRVRHRVRPPSRKMRNRAASCPKAAGIAT